LIADETVNVLIANLADSRPAVRREAIVRLAQLGPSASDAIPGVTNRLHDEDLFVRAHAARAACRIGIAPDVVVPVLSDLLQPYEPKLCCLASLMLGEIGSPAWPAVPTLHACMKSSDASVRLHAAEAILKIDAADATALRELLAGADDDSADLRYFAICALGAVALENGQALFALHRSLTDQDSIVAVTAAVNLMKRLDIPSVEARQAPDMEELAGLIEDLQDTSANVRQAAAIRLGLSGRAARRATVALHGRLADPDFAVRLHAAHALWQIGPPSPETLAREILPELIDLLGISKSNVRFAATFVLGQIGPAAGDALPPLYDMFSGSKLRDQSLITAVISRIDPRDREMIANLIAALHEPEGEVRYLSAMALGTAPLVHQRRVERALTTASADRNLRVQQAAAEALDRLRLRSNQARRAVTAQVSSLDSPEAGLGSALPSSLQDQTADNTDELTSDTLVMDAPRNNFDESDDGPSRRNSIPPIAEVSQTIERKQASAYDAYKNPDEGLRPIREVGASIRPLTTDKMPDDYAFARFAGERTVWHELGMSRGWSSLTYGWDAPAVYFKPLYFEDINLERYGIHYGLCSPIISFGKFFGSIPFLIPCKMVVQPPCECLYTLGYERPNNCVPVHCFGWGCPNMSLLRWCDRNSCSCPIRPACPWTRDFRACATDCTTGDE
jgi:HEAT repeat protein